MRIIDLSVPLEPSPSEPVPVEIEFVSHAEGADILGRPAGLDRTAFPDGMAVSLEHVRLTSHSGTHVDAPSHYGPLSGGRPARTIDQLPLEWFIGPGVLLDLATGADKPVGADEIETAFAAIGHQPAPGEIVLLRTATHDDWGDPRYFTDFRGVTGEATAFLVEAGIRVIGIDSFGFDAPFDRMLERYHAGRGPAALWPAHLYGRQREYCQIERLTNLAAIGRATGFTVICLPVRLAGAGAGWCRAVAVLDDAPPAAPGVRVTAARDLATDLPRAVEWFARPLNLPRWTGFFTEVGPAGPDGRHPAVTALGSAIETWTEVAHDHERALVTICSLIDGRVERARLDLRSCGAAVHATFDVTLLHAADPATVAAQQARMESELDRAHRQLERGA